MQAVSLGQVKEQSYTMKESLRALKTNIQFCGDDVQTILITSSIPNEGKSTVTMDLGRSLTESGKRVLLIDTDMRKSVLIGRLRAKNMNGGEIHGLSHLLSGQKKLEEVLYTTSIPKLFMVFAGPSVPNPTEILDKKYFGELLEFARKHFDYVLLDCAPLGGGHRRGGDREALRRRGHRHRAGDGQRPDDRKREEAARDVRCEDIGRGAQ